MIFLWSKAAETWSSQLTSSWCRDQEIEDL
jgi:hypothetical protein